MVGPSRDRAVVMCVCWSRTRVVSKLRITCGGYGFSLHRIVSFQSEYASFVGEEGGQVRRHPVRRDLTDLHVI